MAGSRASCQCIASIWARSYWIEGIQAVHYQVDSMENAIHISFVHLSLQGSKNMIVAVDEVDEGFFLMG